jgi:response regulator RpfG family c-di-GMP phosphodiesterase
MAVTASLDIRVTLNILLDQLATQSNIDAGCVLLFSPLSRELEYAASRGFRTSAITQVRMKPGEGLAGGVLQNRKILVIPDLTGNSDPLISNLVRRGEVFSSYIGLPLVAKGSVKGVIEIFSRSPIDPDDDWLDFLQAVAAQAAIAIDHAELFKQLQRSNEDLTISYDATIEGWAHALELRDRGTEGHTRRVTELTLRLAQHMGGLDEQMVHLRRGVLLHDIGKMAIPDEILLKRGPLTDDEWKIMKRHPVYAYELLSPIPYLQPAIEIPYSHHEHWDGSGYPQGLSGDNIPMASRIFSVIDVWDALRNDRPYRRAWPEKRVLAYIQDQAGRLFDPQVIPAFLEQVQLDKH